MANFLFPVSAAPVAVISSASLDDFNESFDLLFDPLFAVEFLFVLSGLSGGDGLPRVPVRLPLTAASPIPSSGTAEVRHWDLAALSSAVWAAFLSASFRFLCNLSASVSARPPLAPLDLRPLISIDLN